MEFIKTITEFLQIITNSHCSPSLDLDPNQFGGQKVHVIKWGSGDINVVSIGYSFSTFVSIINLYDNMNCPYTLYFHCKMSNLCV